MSDRRAWLIGTSLITPAGRTASETFDACLARRCAAEPSGLPAPMDRVPAARLSACDQLEAEEARWPERSAALAVLAAREALRSARLGADALQCDRCALVAGASKAGAPTILKALESNRGDAKCRQQNHLAQAMLWGGPSCIAQAVATDLKPAGEVLSISAACATGLLAVLHGARLIEQDRADHVLVVAADATIHPLFLAAFSRMGALADWRREPGDACRPFSPDRDGFVLGEGAGAIVLTRAPAESVADFGPPTPLCVGGGAAGTLPGLVNPPRAAEGQAGWIRRALADAHMSPDDIGMIHAHGTGTTAGDAIEAQAIRTVWPNLSTQPPVFSTKPITGHLLGAAGIAQVILTAEAVARALVPPTANLTEVDPACDIAASSQCRSLTRQFACLCLAHGFGGAGGALILRPTEP